MMEYYAKMKYYETDTTLFLLCLQAEALVEYLEEPLTQVAAS